MSLAPVFPIAVLLIALSSFAATAPVAAPWTAMDPSYQVTYQVDASVRTPPATAWSPLYSSPFGISVGYGTGPIFSDPAITDPAQPNCFRFTFTPRTSNGLLSLRQEIEAVEYRGDSLCSPLDPGQIQVLAVVDMTVEQKQSNTFQLPYFGGQQIQIQLSQSWAIRRGIPREVPREVP